MSGFIASGTLAPATAIQSDGFWPEVNPDTVRKEMRLDASVSDERLRAALLAAVMKVNDELASWRATQVPADITGLADMPGPEVDGAKRLVRLYLRAVSCCAAADIAEQYRSFDATDSGNQRADDLTPSVDEMRRNHRWAIRDFLGVPRVTVELI